MAIQKILLSVQPFFPAFNQEELAQLQISSEYYLQIDRPQKEQT